MSESLDRFIAMLLRSEIISESQIKKLRRKLEEEKKSASSQDLAQELADSGHLTDFQVGELRQGNVDSLMIDDYLILDSVGRGGMGQVYRAQHAVMKREVAIKFTIPDDDGQVNPKSADRFQREVEAASRLSHPNIVSSLDAGKHGEVCYLVMEYVRGVSLSTYVRDNGPMSFSQALDCLIQVAQGLEFAHRKGIIHRDIKPGNLLLTYEGQVKILDMGLARVRCRELDSSQTSPDNDLTHQGQLLGTIDYMAPEQALDPRAVDSRADIYSLGCTAFYLLTGKPPFRIKGSTQMSRLIAHRERAIPHLSGLREDIPAKFEDVFMKMMAKEPKQRYPSCSELIYDLRKCQLAIEMAEPSVTETVTLKKEADPAPAKPAFRLPALAFLFLVAVGSTSFLFTNKRTGSLPLPASSESLELQKATPVEATQASEGSARHDPINLLTKIDLSKHVLAGKEWKYAENKLIVSAGVPSKLLVPTDFAPEFQIRLNVQRQQGTGPLVLGVSSPKCHFYFLVDARRHADETVTALGTDQKGHLVASKTNAFRILANQPVDILLRATPKSVSLQSNGKTILQWQGNLSDLTLGGGWSVGAMTGIMLGSNENSSFEVSRLELSLDSDNESPIDSSITTQSQIPQSD